MPPADRVALVVGATGQLGRAVTADLAADGHRVGIVGSDAGRLAALATELGLPDGRWHPAVAALPGQEAATTAVESVAGHFGRLDVVVHVVGGWRGGASVADADLGDFEAMLDQHLWSTLHVVRAVLPRLLDAGWGRILSVSTPVATAPPPKLGPYAIGKAALEALFATVAREVAGTGVTANLVLVRSIISAADAAAGKAGTTPEQISATLRWLASDAAASVNGARIPLHAS
jgi:NAD(P)-dependent dehydrogenase (short-subunit alcohol dehydrogenase family)